MHTLFLSIFLSTLYICHLLFSKFMFKGVPFTNFSYYLPISSFKYSSQQFIIRLVRCILICECIPVLKLDFDISRFFHKFSKCTFSTCFDSV